MGLLQANPESFLVFVAAGTSGSILASQTELVSGFRFVLGFAGAGEVMKQRKVKQSGVHCKPNCCFTEMRISQRTLLY